MYKQATIVKFIGLRGKKMENWNIKCFSYQDPEEEIYWKVKQKNLPSQMQINGFLSYLFKSLMTWNSSFKSQELL